MTHLGYDKYGRLTALLPHPSYTDGNRLWYFACDCGKEFVASYTNLKRRHNDGELVSCGCVRPGKNKHFIKDLHEPGTEHPVYKAWVQARNISQPFLHEWRTLVSSPPPTLADEWRIFPVFYDAVFPTWEPDLILDRPVLYKDLGPGNMEWVTQADYNHRRDISHMTLDSCFGVLTAHEFAQVFSYTKAFLGVAIPMGINPLELSHARYGQLDDIKIIDTPQGPMSIAAASRISGLPQATLAYRLHNDWPAEELFDEPSLKNRRRPQKRTLIIHPKQNASGTRIPFEGGYISATEASRRTGIPRVTLIQRVKRGWPIDRLLEPVTKNQAPGA